jgi:maltose O-acetyltransferase
MGNLGSYRKKIDNIDRKIVKLLESRFEAVQKISGFKKTNHIGIEDKKRELEVLVNIKKHSESHRKFLAGIFREIIRYSKKLQK